MTVQQARNELKQVRLQYDRICALKRRLAEVRQSMSGIRLSRLDGAPARGATYRDNYRLEKAIDSCNELELQIAEGIVTMYEDQQRLVERIEQLDEPYSSALIQRYIHFDSYKDIGRKLKYMQSSVKRFVCGGVKTYADKFDS